MSLLLSAVAAACVHTQESEAPQTIAFELADETTPVASAYVNGNGPYWFILDTGAVSTTIRQPLLDAVALPRIDHGDREVSTAGGTARADFYRLSTVRLGSLARSDVEAPLLGNVHFDSHVIHGVAGVDFFATSCVIFDFPVRRVSASTRCEPLPSWRHVEARFDPRGYVFVELVLNGHTLPALLDTGAAMTLANPAAAALFGWNPQTPGVESAGTMRGSTGDPIPVYVITVDGVSWDGSSLGAINVLFGDIPAFNWLSSNGEPMLILGAEALGRSRFAIDYPGQALFVLGD